MAASKIHFIGGGQMAEAIIRAVTGNGTYKAAQISVADIHEERTAYLSAAYGVEADPGKRHCPLRT
jgi:pyrroline-5-carboxylate reductase